MQILIAVDGVVRGEGGGTSLLRAGGDAGRQDLHRRPNGALVDGNLVSAKAGRGAAFMRECLKVRHRNQAR
jgi:hypothetical protein